ncbi:MAG: DUF2169 domain-containing protein, partial [Candidatus Adiutrix sp.]|nr:DUF2169 domain-containing protein [Candidatus Adiutrix sp.]
MQVIKDIEQSLLFSAVGLGGQWRLQVAVMLFFKLDDPETALSEQELWPLVQARLGPETLLDAGFPKPRGEFLAAGRAFWPGQPKLYETFKAATGREPTPGRGLAQIQVGGLRRALAVFGPRRWSVGPGGPAPGAPEDFTAVPLTWNMAYGGDERLDNPGGLGAVRRLSPAGQPYRPLPQVEEARGLIGGPDDQPAPASFLPCPLSWPSRKPLAGTYDDFWLRRRWPGFPDDLDPNFFSVAGPGQILPEGFFQGGERVVIEGCHPEKYRLESFVPRARVRLFVTSAPDPKKPEEQKFAEAQTRLETVWLFPEDERGLTLYRALIPTVDEEFGDLNCLFVAVEAEGQPPKTLEDYLQEQKRRRAASAPIDMSPFQKAADKVNETVRNLRTLEQDVDLELERHLGRGPTAPTTVNEVIDDHLANFGRLKSLLTDQKKLLSDTKKQFGHLMPVDVRLLGPMEANLAKMEEKLLAQKTVLAEAAAKTSAMAKKNLGKLRDETLTTLPLEAAGRVREALAGLGLDPQTLESPPLDGGGDPWSRQTLKLLAQGRRNLTGDDERRRRLSALGLRSRDIKAGLFGLLPQALEIDLSQWGLKEPPPGWSGRLGPGWLIPEFSGALAVSLLTRPFDESPFSPVRPTEGDFLLPGSRPGVRLLGGGLGRPLVLALDPFAAWLLYAEAGDQYMVLQMSDPGAEPPAGAAEILASAPLAVLPVPAGLVDDPGQTEAWLGLLPGLTARGFEKGAHLFEARRAGFDLRNWLMDFLPDIGLEAPPAYGVSLPEKPEEAGQLTIKFPEFDLAGLAARSRAKVEAHVAGKIPSPPEHFEAVKNKIMAETRQFDRYLKPHGQSTDEIFKKFARPDKIEAPQPAGPNQELLGHLDDLEKRLDKIGVLPPQGRAKLARIRDSHIETATKTAELHQKGLDLLDWGRGLLKNPFPPEAAAEAKAKGVDLTLTPTTVERVLALYARGETITGLNLSGLDFSGRDLKGLRLSRVFFNQTLFKDADLSESDWRMCSGREADFSGACLKNASFNLSSAAEAAFLKADLAGLKGFQT